MSQTTPYLIFKTSIANALIDSGLFDPSWFDSQEARISMYWNCGETCESAAEMIIIFAEGRKHRYVSPTDHRFCLGVDRF